MKDLNRKPQFLVTYLCSSCGMESGLADIEEPQCHYCDATTGLTVISNERITPEIMAARLKKSTDNMMHALERAYELLPKDQLTDEPNEEEEARLLEIMAEAQALRDHIRRVQLREEEE